jgi:fucose 4-O-acetylase-like acetyltransferase
MKNRVDWVDYAIAIGIALVVYGHVARGLHNAGIAIPKHFYEMADSVVYSFHMPLFFFLSGLFFFDSFKKLGGTNLALKKLDTIVYPYLVWSLLQGATEIAFSKHTNGNDTIEDVFNLLWAPRAQFWFLYVLYAIFVASSALYSILRREISGPLLAIAAIVYLAPILHTNFWIAPPFSSNFVFFVFGIFFTSHTNKANLSSTHALFGTFCAFIIGQWLLHGPIALKESKHGISTLLLACTSILFIVSLSKFLSKRSYKILPLIGSSSLEIYLMHIIAGSGARILLSKIFLVESPSVHLVMGCASGIFLPLIATKIIDKLHIPYLFSAPVSSWIKNNFKGNYRKSDR